MSISEEMKAKKKFSATDAEIEIAQQRFDFLIPFGSSRTIFTPEEVSRCICFGVDFVLKLVEEGELEAHRASAFGTRLSNRITRRSVCVWLMRKSNYDDLTMIQWLEEIGSTLSPATRIHLASFYLNLNNRS